MLYSSVFGMNLPRNCLLFSDPSCMHCNMGPVWPTLCSSTALGRQQAFPIKSSRFKVHQPKSFLEHSYWLLVLHPMSFQCIPSLHVSQTLCEQRKRQVLKSKQCDLYAWLCYLQAYLPKFLDSLNSSFFSSKLGLLRFSLWELKSPVFTFSVCYTVIICG